MSIKFVAATVMAAWLLAGCGTCKVCNEKQDACMASCDSDITGCINDCATTTDVGGCESECDAEFDACAADCDVDQTSCESKEC